MAKHLTYKDRKIISAMYDDEIPVYCIGAKVGVCPDTIYAELKRGYTGELNSTGRKAYDPMLGQRTMQEHLSHCGAYQRRGKKKADKEGERGAE